MKKVYVGKWTLAITLIFLGSTILWNMYATPRIPVGDVYPLVFVLLGLELIIKALLRKERKVSLEGGTVILLVGIMFLINIVPYSFLGPGPKNLFSQEHPIGQFFQELSRGNRVFNFEGMGEYNTTYEIEETFSAEEIQGIEVENAFGDITMESAVGEEVVVVIEVQSSNDDPDYVEELKEELFSVETQSDEWLIWTSNNRRYLEEKRIHSLRMNYRIYLPEDVLPLSLEIQNEFGDITIHDFKGGITINNRHGDVTVRNSSGVLDVDNNFGNIRVTALEGKGNIKNRHGNVTLENPKEIIKELYIENEFGSLDLEFSQEQAGTFDFRTTFGEITSDLDGVEGGFAESSINEELFQGRIDGLDGFIKASNRHGDIHVKKSVE